MHTSADIQHVDDVIPPVQKEIMESCKVCLPECKGAVPSPSYHSFLRLIHSLEWTKLCMADLFVKIVARVSSEMFGGSQLSHNEEWVRSTIEFAMDGFIGAQKIKKIPAWLRPVAQYFVPELRRVEDHHSTARRVIIPILQERETKPEKPSDFLQWMSDSALGPEKDKAFIASIQLKLSFAAIHTSAAAPTQLLYDLCTMPQYIEPLREEVRANLAEHGSFTKRSLLKLEKMDSFMKESQRFNPLLLSASFATFLRHRADSKQSRLNDWSLKTTRCLMALSFPRERLLAYPRKQFQWTLTFMRIQKSLTGLGSLKSGTPRDSTMGACSTLQVITTTWLLAMAGTPARDVSSPLARSR